MSIPITTVTSVPAAALPRERATQNFADNFESLRSTQPSLHAKLPPLPTGLDWVLGRDGSLTALMADGAWWAGCSLPWRAARAMFKSLRLDSLTGCFLSPGWAAQVRLCLELVEPRQAVLAVTPELADLTVMLHCEAFAEDITSGRLWFAAGDDWADQLEVIFEQQPGLMVPTQFIRAMSQNMRAIEAMIAPAQKVFADVNARRSAILESLRQSHSASDRLCIVCPSQFGLWQDAGSALAEAMARLSPEESDKLARLDPDCPISASPLGLARSAQGCDALLIPDAGRADLPGIVADDVAWITWITRGAIPSCVTAGPRDRLLLADRAWQRLALAAGWPEDRITIAEWPTSPANAHSPTHPPHLAMLVDTLPAAAPKSVTDFSSQGILWDQIRRELLADPFAVGDDAELFLNRLVRELELAPESLDRRVFLSELVIPAYQHGLALHLVKAGIPLKLFGKGWDAVSGQADGATLESAWAGPLRSSAELAAAAGAATALVHAWPSRSAHPIYRYRRPVLGPSLSPTAFLREATRLLRGDSSAIHPTSPLSLTKLLR